MTERTSRSTNIPCRLTGRPATYTDSTLCVPAECTTAPTGSLSGRHVRAQHQRVGLLAHLERADAVVETAGPGTVGGGHRQHLPGGEGNLPERVAAGERLRVVGAALQADRHPHGSEEVTPDVRADVGGQTRGDSPGPEPGGRRGATDARPPASASMSNSVSLSMLQCT